MNIHRQQSAAENELMEALSAVQTDLPPQWLGNCPGEDELRSFVRGKASPKQRERLVAHLSSCDRCIEFLHKRRERRSLVRRGSLVIATAAAAIAIWVGSQHRIPAAGDVAVVDLRAVLLTRGGQSVTAAGEAPTIERGAGRLRLILPASSEGRYECKILGANAAPLLEVSGEASVQERQAVLDLPIHLSPIPAGHYTLALHRAGSDWLYYPVVLE
jgi:hypothetical protein